MPDTMMQVQLHGGSCLLPTPQLPQACLRFPKPGVKNVNERHSHSHGTALSFPFAVQSQILAGRQADLTRGDTVGVSRPSNNGACWSQLFLCEEYLPPAVSMSNPTVAEVMVWQRQRGSEQTAAEHQDLLPHPHRHFCARPNSLTLPDALSFSPASPHTHTALGHMFHSLTRVLSHGAPLIGELDDK